MRLAVQGGRPQHAVMVAPVTQEGHPAIPLVLSLGPAPTQPCPLVGFGLWTLWGGTLHLNLTHHSPLYWRLKAG